MNIINSSQRDSKTFKRQRFFDDFFDRRDRYQNIRANKQNDRNNRNRENRNRKNCNRFVNREKRRDNYRSTLYREIIRNETKFQCRNSFHNELSNLRDETKL